MNYKSDIYELIHKTAVLKFKIGAITEARLREYDKMCFAEDHDVVYSMDVSRSPYGSLS